jgi:hypothetical protein
MEMILSRLVITLECDVSALFLETSRTIQLVLEVSLCITVTFRANWSTLLSPVKK